MSLARFQEDGLRAPWLAPDTAALGLPLPFSFSLSGMARRAPPRGAGCCRAQEGRRAALPVAGQFRPDRFRGKH